MQNEPNFTPKPFHFAHARGTRVTGHGSRFIQNEPNFTHKAPTKHAKDEDFTHIFSKKNTKYYEILQNNPKIYSQKVYILITFSTLFPSFSITFTRFSALFVLFSNFLTLTHLTPCTTKTYITFYPKIHFTRGIYTHLVRREKMKNKPNLTPPGLIFYVTNILTYCVTNLLNYSYMQNEPNLNHRAMRDKLCKTNPIQPANDER